MTKLGFLRLSYEKQDTLLKLLILSMAAVLCKSSTSFYITCCLRLQHCLSPYHKLNYVIAQTLFLLSSAFSTRLFSVLRFESVIHEFDP